MAFWFLEMITKLYLQKLFTLFKILTLMKIWARPEGTIL
jgi:hypothetical protein